MRPSRSWSHVNRSNENCKKFSIYGCLCDCILVHFGTYSTCSVDMEHASIVEMKSTIGSIKGAIAWYRTPRTQLVYRQGGLVEQRIIQMSMEERSQQLTAELDLVYFEWRLNILAATTIQKRWRGVRDRMRLVDPRDEICKRRMALEFNNLRLDVF